MKLEEMKNSQEKVKLQYHEFAGAIMILKYQIQRIEKEIIERGVIEKEIEESKKNATEERKQSEDGK
jgi:hypothetical protein